MHELFTPFSSWSSMYSPEMLIASSKWPRWKFRVGRMLRPFVVLTMPAVPKRFIELPRWGCSANSSRTVLVYALNASGSSISSLRLPSMLIALRCFAPMTAPTPERPAMRSFETMPA